MFNINYTYKNMNNKIINSRNNTLQNKNTLPNKKNTLPSYNIYKLKYREFCNKHLNYIRNLKLCNIVADQKYEAVLIEFRKLPHIEFLLRNTIHKLNSEWSHTIICGNLNYNFIVNICKQISPNIKIIQLPYDNVTQSEYSNYLCKLEFWNLLVGEKILLYQEDTCIFKHNINDFLEWDYIGAPWNLSQNDTPNCVGNGGFSLRTKQCMIDVINTISLENTTFNNSTLNYMSTSNLTDGPEDVYFSLNMQKYNIGKVAPYEVAFNFASESVYNPNSLGGHCFWLSDLKWKQRMYQSIIIQFKPFYEIESFEHRGGWKSVLTKLNDNNFFHDKSNLYFFDMIEHFFLWDKNYICNSKWSGIIHCTPNTPQYMNIINIQNLFTNNNFLISLKNCMCIITLSSYVSDFLNKKLSSLNINNINIITLQHPIDNKNIPLFDIDKFINNPSKIIIQLGQQLRKISSIFLLQPPKEYSKLWLTGTQNFQKLKKLLLKEIDEFAINTDDFTNVNMKYTKSFVEYDNYLTNNIVLIHLFDAAANNAVLECIVRGTPMLINKLDGVVEYLGEAYPLYFENLSDIENLLTYDNIYNAHIYLKKLKTVNIDTFSSQLINLFHDLHDLHDLHN